MGVPRVHARFSDRLCLLVGQIGGRKAAAQPFESLEFFVFGRCYEIARDRSTARYRHGLTLSITSSAAYAKQLDKLVREIAGNTEDPILLERARAIAQAELELARVRRVKVALIERASAFGEPLFNAFVRGRPIVPKPADSSATMPSHEPDRSAESAHRGVRTNRTLRSQAWPG